MSKLFTILFGGSLAVFPAGAATIFGVTTQQTLVRFHSSAPGSVTSIGTFSGLNGGEIFVGIDFRPSNGMLYGLSNQGNLYTIETGTAAVTRVNTGPGVALSGTQFGFDFNPVPDLIRVVSHSGQNLRINPNTGALVNSDAALNPGTPNAVGAAYTNNFAGATTTQLFVIDSSTNQLLLQSPPNDGRLNLIGSLGVDVGDALGFDISPFDGTAFGAFNLPGVAGTQLYSVNLSTGAASLIGGIGGASLTGIAVDTSAIPEPGTYLLLAGGLAAIGLLRRRAW